MVSALRYCSLAQRFIVQLESIQNKIYKVRDQIVMLDYDLAGLYKVPTRVLNQSVKRNIKRFPPEFMFSLTVEEWVQMMSQIVTSSQIRRKMSARPYAFTEYGIAMLSSILKSDYAIDVNVQIMKAFIDYRRFLMRYSDMAEEIADIRKTVDNHEERLTLVYSVIEKILNEKAKQFDWKDRDRIGYK